jgi:hypothetical protein
MYIRLTKREPPIEDDVPQASWNQGKIPNNLAILEISDRGRVRDENSLGQRVGEQFTLAGAKGS